MLKKVFANVRKRGPLVHNITNYVTVNEVANILLACGGSPIMADDSEEVEEITAICGGLHLNIGTLNRRTVVSMLLAGKKANELNRPVLLDPVGAGASTFRTETAMELMGNIRLTAIRGNISEIKTLALGRGTTKGVDADVADAVTEENLDQVVSFVQGFAQRSGAVIAMTGAIDVVADGKQVFLIRNGHRVMASITGSGCMLSALITAYLVANPEEAGWAAATATSVMGLAGERAHQRMLDEGAGNASFRNYLIDEIFKMDEATLEAGAKCEVR